MAKNVGKTECLNYLLERLEEAGRRVALTSTGIDGERAGQPADAREPGIRIHAGTLFVTTERHYRERRLVAEILDVSDRQTALGRLVTARAVTAGRVLLSGPPDTRSLGEWIADAARRGAEITLVEGALSRLSLASPAVTGGVILATGAAVSGSIRRVVQATRHVHDLMELEEVDEETRRKLSGIERGLHAIDDAGEVHDLHVPSAFLVEGHKEAILSRGATLFVAGAVSDALLRFLRGRREAAGITLVARDFTRVFASPGSCRDFLSGGGRLRVLSRCRLVAVCANPLAPGGYRLDADELLAALREGLPGVPVYDIKRMDETCYSRKR
jgi:hypothetical protein